MSKYYAIQVYNCETGEPIINNIESTSITSIEVQARKHFGAPSGADGYEWWIVTLEEE